jgi:hypothetical protein
MNISELAADARESLEKLERNKLNLDRCADEHPEVGLIPFDIADEWLEAAILRTDQLITLCDCILAAQSADGMLGCKQ